MLITSIVTITLGAMLSNGLSGYRTNDQISSVEQEAEVAAVIMTHDIRLAGNSGGDGSDIELIVTGVTNPAVQQTKDFLRDLYAEGSWPFEIESTSAVIPTIKLVAPGGTTFDGANCTANLGTSGCLEVIYVSDVNDAFIDSNSDGVAEGVYSLAYTRYWVEDTDVPGDEPDLGILPYLYRAYGQYDSCESDFDCNITATAVAGAIARGIEDFQLFWLDENADATDWKVWSTDPASSDYLSDGIDRRVGIYLRARSVLPSLSRIFSYSDIQIDLPSDIDANHKPPISVNDEFRRIEKWIDIRLMNPQETDKT